MIQYKETKKIPKQKLFNLFDSVGWIKFCKDKVPKCESGDYIANHKLNINKNSDLLKKSFENSTYVVSAWDKEKLIGIVRVLSDQVQRSIIYDLAVLPSYQGQKVGKTLIDRCLKKFSKTQFLLGTSSKNFSFYKKFGFKNSGNYLERESLFF